MSFRLLKVVRFEYLQTLRRAGFWLGTLFLPVFIGVLMGISGWSSFVATENVEQKLADDSQTIVVVDESGVIRPQAVSDVYELQSELQPQIDRVKSGQIKAVFHLPSDFVETKSYQVYARDQGVFVNFGYEGSFDRLMDLTVVGYIESAEGQELFGSGFTAENSVFYNQDGQEVDSGLEALVLPIISFVVFFMAVFISAQYLLQSVAEEKENRMIETILSVISSRSLIVGKIVGLSLVVLTQLSIWVVGGVLSVVMAQNFFDFSSFVSFEDILGNIQVGSVLVTVLMTFLGFLLFSAIMVGVGSVAASYKDSQSLSSVFIISAIMPIYFVSAILSDPTGIIAQIFSYFPTTSALVLLFRNALGALAWWELGLGIVLNLFYVILAFWAAVKLFDLGILMYNRKPTWKEIRSMFGG